MDKFLTFLYYSSAIGAIVFGVLDKVYERFEVEFYFCLILFFAIVISKWIKELK